MVILGSYWTLDTDSSSFIQLTTGVGEPETGKVTVKMGKIEFY